MRYEGCDRYEQCTLTIRKPCIPGYNCGPWGPWGKPGPDGGWSVAPAGDPKGYPKLPTVPIPDMGGPSGFEQEYIPPKSSGQPLFEALTGEMNVRKNL